MPNIKSAIKRVKTNERKNLENRVVKSQISTIVKKYRAAIQANDPAAAESLLPVVYATIDSAVSKGVIHKNNAANKKSALAKTLSDLKSGKLVITAKVDNKTRIAEKRAREEAARIEAREAAKKLREEKAAAKEAAGKAPAKAAKKTKKDEPAKAEAPKAKKATSKATKEKEPKAEPKAAKEDTKEDTKA